VFGALAFFGYLGISHAVLNLFPFSTFEMYASTPAGSASRILVRTGDGSTREVTALAACTCDRPIDIEPSGCASHWPFFYIPYKDREDAGALERAPAAPIDAERVVIVRRIWRVPRDGGAPPFLDCVLASCRATVR
jgi:hypothetical protein